MTAKAQHENFLVVTGRALVDGKTSLLTLEEWLYMYGEIKGDLAAAKARIFAGLEAKIRNRILEREMESVAV